MILYYGKTPKLNKERKEICELSKYMVQVLICDHMTREVLPCVVNKTKQSRLNAEIKVNVTYNDSRLLAFTYLSRQICARWRKRETKRLITLDCNESYLAGSSEYLDHLYMRNFTLAK